ncbi:precorrin-6A reductase [Actinoplanes sp. OR16]|uniref:cobalt-precorrin-6A reductase n=1 Tax=Actinoplanes sp. OR16 TaxID=946334 RepID=UPI000F6C8341|nr:cobalt-precorrin-6A reductase [Actinoplanes sp. OR16]BBH64080.1 precorrin-6A reductase [Actinoplanes sp. OR16]
MRILLLGGTSDARQLATLLVEAGHDVISSLAGRTREPLLPAGRVRIGGFGGVAGLAAFLRDERIDVLIDATHPFAATITSNAALACGDVRGHGPVSRSAGVPRMVLRRPGWIASPGDEWHRVASLDAAAGLIPELGHRVFLTTGRQGIAAFAGLDGCWFLARSVEPPDGIVPRRLSVILDRGPFTVDGERRLMTDHRIGVLVTKDSGGADAKLVAARELGLPVVMVDRPVLPPGPVVSTPAEAIALLAEN